MGGSKKLSGFMLTGGWQYFLLYPVLLLQCATTHNVPRPSVGPSPTGDARAY